MRIGIDTGGTFTDFIVLGPVGLRVHKVLSDPESPLRAIVKGLEALGVEAQSAFQLVHGTTIATNTLLERKGARCAYITNRGFADILTLGRQARSELYNLTAQPEAPPVPEALCFETGGRIGADGQVLEPLREEDLAVLCHAIEGGRVQAVAINLLFSFLDDRFERQIEQALPQKLFISRSSQVVPEVREYERGIATWLNSYVGPFVHQYIQDLAQAFPKAQVEVMQSHGGTLDASHASRHAVRLLLSGPAGGLAAARQIGQQVGESRILSLDMGGTSTDVALIDGDLQLTAQGNIGGYAVPVPMVDMHTIGAGGGSLAYRDSGGILRVGPQSAGSRPGPACYGWGGRAATVTDAHVVLGWLPEHTRLAGNLPLDSAAARQAMEVLARELGLSVMDTARGIIRVANENMAQALRMVSVQQGHHPKDFTLMSFGGAGGLHLCALAEAQSMTRALVPVHAGAFSALGLLLAPQGRELARTVPLRLTGEATDAIEQGFESLAAQVREEIGEAAFQTWQQTRTLDLRYEGQSSTLPVPWISVAKATKTFHHRHHELFGSALEASVELVNLRLSVQDPIPPPTLPLWPDQAPGAAQTEVRIDGLAEPVPVYQRSQLAVDQRLVGPAIILEETATTRLSPKWFAQIDAYGNIRLTYDD